jgi:hypothetical protein
MVLAGRAAFAQSGQKVWHRVREVNGAPPGAQQVAAGRPALYRGPETAQFAQLRRRRKRPQEPQPVETPVIAWRTAASKSEVVGSSVMAALHNQLTLGAPPGPGASSPRDHQRRGSPGTALRQPDPSLLRRTRSPWRPAARSASRSRAGRPIERTRRAHRTATARRLRR